MSKTSQRNVIVLGLDGLDPGIVEQMIGNGTLPAFGRLAERGGVSPLETVSPPQSPVAWTTIATGMEPAEHGIYDFLTRDPGEYRPKLSILKQGKLGYVSPFQVDPFWQWTTDRGMDASVLKWPLTFPARPLKGRLLTGLGTPDIKGTLGRYAWYSTAAVDNAAEKKGTLHHVTPEAGVIETVLEGPVAVSLKSGKPASVPMKITLGNGSVGIDIDGQHVELAPGQWSPWLRAHFKVGFMRKVSALFRVHLVSSAPEFSLYVTPLNISSDAKSLPISYPSGYGRELEDALGPYATLGLAEDANALNDNLLPETAFLDQCRMLMDEREQLFRHELDRFSAGKTTVLACVFDTTDRVQHMFWRYQESGHPARAENEAVAGAVTEFYARADAMLQLALDRAGPETLVIALSDHGFSSFRRAAHVNSYLARAGFMRFEEGKTTSAELFEHVDFSRTQAFAYGLNSMSLNLAGREKKGIVEKGQAASVLADVKTSLLAWKDGEHAVIDSVTSVESSSGGPDLVIGFTPGYRASWQTALGEAPGGPDVEDNTRNWSGDHCLSKEHVPGVCAVSEAGLGRPRAIDIAPLIKDYLG
ncbi:alkaline phosphatase family protein [Desulfovibrio inopinatus]|uniref:alkaline phosphatase family protein n=1 Tax=Desulfovibrio inopinatus TaxID=102109 RepID=UPI00041208C3|nr:alkaline phosphatase family protein [Desulfovibrio inopinatus]